MALERWISRKYLHTILRRQLIGLSLLVIITYLSGVSLAWMIVLPSRITVDVGESIQIPIDLPRIAKSFINYKVKSIQGAEILKGKTLDIMGLPVANEPGTVSLELRLFGLIPLKKMLITVTEPVYVIPGGHSIGVFLRTKGVIVTDFDSIRIEEGQERSPAKEGGLQLGDVILQGNGEDIRDEFHLAQIVNTAGQAKEKVVLLVERGKKQRKIVVQPIYCKETRRFRIGLLVKDGFAGVGTLSFYDPKTNTYGALGHIIQDSHYKSEVVIKNGQIVSVRVQGIKPGQKGLPGEKIGIIENIDSPFGTIIKNTQFGIYGTLKKNVINDLYPEPIPVAWQNQVHQGPAKMLTVIENTKIDSFQVEIEKLMVKRPEGKGMIIKITDPRLLKKTGGIIQGMSGSPLIQDGRLIGVVTHVFVNDPLRGYALFVEYMLSEAKQISPRVKNYDSWVLLYKFFNRKFFMY